MLLFVANCTNDEKSMFSEYFFVTLCMSDLRLKYMQNLSEPLDFLRDLFNDDDGYEMIRSGSSVERTRFPSFYLENEREIEASQSDFDKMNVLKHCYAGDEKETMLYDALVLEKNEVSFTRYSKILVTHT